MIQSPLSETLRSQCEVALPIRAKLEEGSATPGTDLIESLTRAASSFTNECISSGGYLEVPSHLYLTVNILGFLISLL